MPPAYKIASKEPCNQKYCYWMLDLDFAVSRYLLSNIRSVLKSTTYRHHPAAVAIQRLSRYYLIWFQRRNTF